jgi:transposase-like protein
MAKQRHRYTSEFKAKVAMEALKSQRTIQELASQFELHPNQISEWKKELHERASEIFTKSKKPSESDTHSHGELYEQIGRLQVEIAWLKKTLSR